MSKYLFGAAAVCLLGTGVTFFAVFFLMLGRIIEFGPPPFWGAYGMLAAIFFGVIGAISAIAEHLFGAHS